MHHCMALWGVVYWVFVAFTGGVIAQKLYSRYTVKVVKRNEKI